MNTKSEFFLDKELLKIYMPNLEEFYKEMEILLDSKKYNL